MDIVKRLRGYEDGDLVLIEDVNDAIGEIERLRKYVADYKKLWETSNALDQQISEDWSAECKRLREEVCDLKDLMQSTVNYTGISVSTEKYAFHASKALGEKE